MRSGRRSPPVRGLAHNAPRARGARKTPLGTRIRTQQDDGPAPTPESATYSGANLREQTFTAAREWASCLAHASRAQARVARGMTRYDAARAGARVGRGSPAAYSGTLPVQRRSAGAPAPGPQPPPAAGPPLQATRTQPAAAAPPQGTGLRGRARRGPRGRRQREPAGRRVPAGVGRQGRAAFVWRAAAAIAAGVGRPCP